LFSIGAEIDDESESEWYWVKYHADDRPPEVIAKEYSLNPGKYVTYTTRVLGTREAVESFANLYTAVREKLYGVDKALDNIVNPSDMDDIPF
jgi:hypothetical protein